MLQCVIATSRSGRRRVTPAQRHDPSARSRYVALVPVVFADPRLARINARATFGSRARLRSLVVRTLFRVDEFGELLLRGSEVCLEPSREGLELHRAPAQRAQGVIK